MDPNKFPLRKPYSKDKLITYRDELEKVERSYRLMLQKGVPEYVRRGQCVYRRGVPKGLEEVEIFTQETEVIGVRRMTAQLMRREWEEYDGLIKAYEMVRSWKTATGIPMTGAEKWHQDKLEEAIKLVAYESSSKEIADEYTKQIMSFEDYYLRCIKRMQPVFTICSNKFDGMVYEWQEKEEVKMIYMAILKEFRDWLYAHHVDKVFLLIMNSKDATLGEFFKDRPDMAALLRIAQNLPMDFHKHQGDPFVSAEVRAVTEIAIGFIPVVGNIVALWEAFDGHDLFGYELSDTERAIIAAGVFIPMASRLVKGGVAIYSAQKAWRLFGKEVQTWEKAIEFSRKVEQNPEAFKFVEKAMKILVKEEKLDLKIMEAASKHINSMPKLSARASVPLPPALEEEMIQAWEKLVAEHPPLGALDAPAIRRVILRGITNKGTISLSPMRGQIAEELIEYIIIPLLRTRAGKAALGLHWVGNKKLVFYPSHMIESLDTLGARGLVDGMIGYWEKGEFWVVAIFDAKAGKISARSMIGAPDPKKIPGMNQLAEIRWKKLVEEATMNGREFKTPLEEFQKADLLIKMREGNQFKSHLDRLGNGQPTAVMLGGEKVTVRTPKNNNIKMFAVVPQDLDHDTVNLITQEMQHFGFDFEFRWLPLNMNDISAVNNNQPIADLVKKIVAWMPKPPP